MANVRQWGPLAQLLTSVHHFGTVHVVTNAQHITTAQAATLLDTTPRMIHHYVSTNRLEPVQRIGTAMLFDRDAVCALIPDLIRRPRTKQVAS